MVHVVDRDEDGVRLDCSSERLELKGSVGIHGDPVQVQPWRSRNSTDCITLGCSVAETTRCFPRRSLA